MTRREAPVSPPVVLTIAGSDSGGGAGIQADLKTIEARGGFGTSAITSVTAQNTRGVEGSHLLPIGDVEAQIQAVLGDFDVGAVKTGMLATSEVVDLVVEHAPDLPNLVVDPVMVAASGDRLLEPAAEDAYETLVGEATLVTPNADEAEVLTGVTVGDEESAVRAGQVLVEDHGATAALVKGGHVPGDVVCDVLVTADGATNATDTTDATDATTTTTITHERVDTDATHGSGCTLSSAIATELAHGADLTAAVTAGIDLLGSAVRYNLDVGEGPGSVHHLVDLRDDAGLGETIDALEIARDRLEAAAYDRLASPTGDVLVGATPYADTPEGVVTIDVALGAAAGTDGSGSPGRLAVGDDTPLARALLVAREPVPVLRYGLACRYDDAVAATLETLSWARTVEAGDADVTASGEAGTPDRDPLPGAVSRALDANVAPPVAVGVPAGPGGPVTVLFAGSTDALADATRWLVDATAD